MELSGAGAGAENSVIISAPAPAKKPGSGTLHGTQFFHLTLAGAVALYCVGHTCVPKHRDRCRGQVLADRGGTRYSS